MKDNTQNILITGGAGYIGTALVQALIKEGHKVVVFDNLRTGQKNLIDQEAVLVVGDVLNKTQLNDVMGAYNFDLVIHLAALKAVGEGEEQPGEYYETNVTGTLNVLEVMRKYCVPSIVFSSTAAVYKEAETGAYSETDEVAPQSVYGSTKLMCEELIRQYHRMGYIKNFTVFRYFNLAGDAGLGFYDTQAQNVFPRLARAYGEQLTFQVFGNDYNTVDGTGVRDYIHLDDLVKAHIQAMHYPGEIGILNLGTTEGTSVLELVHAFEKCTGNPLPYEFADRRLGDPATVLADVSRAQELLGWSATRNVVEMVESTMKVYGEK